jgi:hypothetical protein
VDAVGDLLRGDRQGRSDLLVRPARHDESEDVRFAVGQAV